MCTLTTTRHKIIFSVLYFCTIFFPIVVYVYCRRIKRGILFTTLSEVTILGVVAIIFTINFTLTQLIMLVILQGTAFGIVIYDAIILLRKKEKELVTLK